MKNENNIKKNNNNKKNIKKNKKCVVLHVSYINVFYMILTPGKDGKGGGVGEREGGRGGVGVFLKSSS